MRGTNFRLDCNGKQLFIITNFQVLIKSMSLLALGQNGCGGKSPGTSPLGSVYATLNAGSSNDNKKRLDHRKASCP